MALSWLDFDLHSLYGRSTESLNLLNNGAVDIVVRSPFAILENTSDKVGQKTFLFLDPEFPEHCAFL